MNYFEIFYFLYSFWIVFCFPFHTFFFLQFFMFATVFELNCFLIDASWLHQSTNTHRGLEPTSAKKHVLRSNSWTCPSPKWIELPRLGNIDTDLGICKKMDVRKWRKLLWHGRALYSTGKLWTKVFAWMFSISSCFFVDCRPQSWHDE